MSHCLASLLIWTSTQILFRYLVFFATRPEGCFHRALMSRPPHKEKGLGENTPDENTAKGKYQTRQNSICLLTSSLVYQWCVSEEQRAAEASVVSHFCSAAGDQRLGEAEGTNRLRERRRRGESRTEGICWIISLQCCSIDLRMDPRRHGALASRPCRCRGALNATDLRAALFPGVWVR